MGEFFCSIIVWLRIFFDEEMFGWDFYEEVFLMTNFFVKNNPKECFIAEDIFLYKRIIQTVPLGQIGSWESAFNYHVVIFFWDPVK